MKAAGAAWILLGAVWWGWISLSERRRRRALLEELGRSLLRMSEEIRTDRTPMPSLLRQRAAECGGDAAAFFRRAGTGEDRSRSWEQAAEALPLSPQERQVLGKLAQDLRGDEIRIRRAFAHAAGYLQQNAREMDRTYREDLRRTAALALCGGIMLAVFLY